jgi:hypothetical protein
MKSPDEIRVWIKAGVSNRRPTGTSTSTTDARSARHRGLFGANGHGCPSKDVNGHFLEQMVWRVRASYATLMPWSNNAGKRDSPDGPVHT